MSQTTKPVSKLKVVSLWLVLLGNLLFWVAFWAWRSRPDVSAVPDSEPESGIARFIFMIVVGGFFLISGLAAYSAVIFTNCFTFDFSRPFFPAFKAKLYLAKIIVPMLIAVAAALILGAFLDPILKAFGLRGQFVFMLPFIITLVPLQIVQMWVSIWKPLTKRLISKRLSARGIPAARFNTAMLVGISDPQKSSFKKMTLVEDDIGALWFDGAQLTYCGDADQFTIAREQIMQIERRADAGSTSMLSGTAHVILHVQLPEGRARQIRFHMEGHWTLGQVRRAMDEFAAAVANWHTDATPIPPRIAVA